MLVSKQRGSSNKTFMVCKIVKMSDRFSYLLDLDEVDDNDDSEEDWREGGGDDDYWMVP